MKRSAYITMLAIAWCLCVIVGAVQLYRYETTPGVNAMAPIEWPLDSRLSRDSTRSTLVMAVHPQCPCSRASIGELAVLMTYFRDRLRAYVVFLHPEGWDREWVETSGWVEAARIPGVTVVDDGDGAEARRFAARTSGQTYLYNEQGRLVFQGGITAARGRRGESEGQRSIAAFLMTGTNDQDRAMTFGCPLFTTEVP